MAPSSQCVMCQDDMAEVECADCGVSKCRDCDRKYHKSEKRASHRRTDIIPPTSRLSSVAAASPRLDSLYQWTDASNVSTFGNGATYPTSQGQRPSVPVSAVSLNAQSENGIGMHSQPPHLQSTAGTLPAYASSNRSLATDGNSFEKSNTLGLAPNFPLPIDVSKRFAPHASGFPQGFAGFPTGVSTNTNIGGVPQGTPLFQEFYNNDLRLNQGVYANQGNFRMDFPTNFPQAPYGVPQGFPGFPPNFPGSDPGFRQWLPPSAAGVPQGFFYKPQGSPHGLPTPTTGLPQGFPPTSLGVSQNIPPAGVPLVHNAPQSVSSSSKRGSESFSIGTNKGQNVDQTNEKPVPAQTQDNPPAANARSPQDTVTDDQRADPATAPTVKDVESEEGAGDVLRPPQTTTLPQQPHMYFNLNLAQNPGFYAGLNPGARSDFVPPFDSNNPEYMRIFSQFMTQQNQSSANQPASSVQVTSSCEKNTTKLDIRAKFCSQCGASLQADAKFCSSCGSAVQLVPRKSETLNSEVPTVDPSPLNSDKCGETTEVSTASPEMKTNEVTTESPTTSHDLEATRRRHLEDVYPEDEFVLSGLATLTFLKSQLEQGSSLEDTMCMLNADTVDGVEDIASCTSAVESNLNVVNDIFVSQINQKLKPDKRLNLSQNEGRYALEATGFDAMKSATFAVNSRTYLFEHVLELSDAKQVLFNEKMQQSQGSYRAAFAELQSGLFDQLIRSSIWNSDEQENILSPPSAAQDRYVKLEETYTDRLIKDSIAKANLKSNATVREKNHIIRQIMAEKVLPNARAVIFLKLLGTKQDLDYLSCLWIAKNMTDAAVRIPRGYDTYIKECEICFGEVAQFKIIKLTNCEAACCVCETCMEDHMVAQLRDSGKNVNNISCPGCENKVLAGDQNDTLVVNHLKNFLPEDLFKLFESRFLDNTLESSVYFKWCSHDSCTDGIEWENPRVLKMRCANGHFTCSECGRKWVDQHEGLTCDQFSQWELENDPEYQNKRLDGYLRSVNAMQCPTCKFRYELIRGGCLHFTCTKCKTEFCGFCYALYSTECRKFQRCANKGLHQHCPRNCYSYLRDYEVKELEELLAKANVEIGEVVRVDVAAAGNKCPIVTKADDGPEQRCEKAVKDNQGGVCELHYKEFLATRINEAKVDPLITFSEDDCEKELFRNEVVAAANLNLDQLKELVRLQLPLP